jgi:hypothetical protein
MDISISNMSVGYKEDNELGILQQARIRWPAGELYSQRVRQKEKYLNYAWMVAWDAVKFVSTLPVALGM